MRYSPRRPGSRLASAGSWRVLAACLSLAALILACGSPNTTQELAPTDAPPQQQPTAPDTERPATPTRPEASFIRGINLSPRGFPNTFEEWESFFDQAAAIPDAAVIWNGAWREDVSAGSDAGEVPDSAVAVMSSARGHDLSSIFVFGWRSGSELHLSVPQDPTDDWSNEAAHELFAKTVREFAAEHQPNYILLGNENDFYYEQDPNDYTNWVRAYERAYSAVKAASPETKVGPVFNLEHLAGAGGLNHWDTPHWGALEGHDLEQVDVIGLTLYPWLGAATPGEVPPDLLAPLLDRIDGKPLVITETGWPAGNPGGLEVQWQYSEAAQVEYLTTLAELLPPDAAEVVSWVFLHPMQDPGGQPVEWKLYSTISLMNEGGGPRPVYEPWLSFTP